MPAPDIQTLMRADERISSIVASALFFSGITAHEQRGDDEISTPCASVQVSLGAALGRLTNFKVDGEYRHDAWRFTLRVAIMTNRADGSQDHESMKAKALEILSGWQSLFSALEFHSVAGFAVDSVSPRIDAGDNVDISEITCGGIVAVKRDAWP